MYFYIVTERQRANVADSDSVTYAAVTVKPTIERGNLFALSYFVSFADRSTKYVKYVICMDNIFFSLIRASDRFVA